MNSHATVKVSSPFVKPNAPSASVNETLLVPSSVPSLIDHTLLKPNATEADVARLCEEARHFGFISVCVNPYWVSFAAGQLGGSATKICTVVGFPLGANSAETKRAEAQQALDDGATELDMVLNVGSLRSGHHQKVRQEIADLAALAHNGNAQLKVILETCLLTREEKIAACEIARDANAHFVKTSTGFGSAGATADDVQLMRQTVGPHLGVKASGGVRTWETLQQMVHAGANRIGTSSGVSILREINGATPALARENTY